MPSSQPNSQFLNTIQCDDISNFITKIEDNSIDVIFTDPPYFIDKLDSNWSVSEVHNPKNRQTIKSLPAGMKFDRQQGVNFYNWYLEISKEFYRVLKPGGFFFSFSSPRLYHRMASAMDDAGFEIRDMFSWLYTQNQMKAMSLDHFINKMQIEDNQKTTLKTRLQGWKTPQIKSCFEPIAMGQKPTHGTYLNNVIKYSVGLINTKIQLGKNSDMCPANVVSTEKIQETIDRAFLVNKPTKTEKGDFNIHSTVKPVELCKYILSLVSMDETTTVLEPFSGSGTTCVASKELGINYIGCELNQEYVEIANKRLQSTQIEIKESKLQIETLF
jgi:site-specific DNA-methyltransferase (adenine-specific)